MQTNRLLRGKIQDATVYRGDSLTKIYRRRRRIKVSLLIIFIGCLVAAFIMLLPFLWMVSASFKAKTEIFTKPIQWIPRVFRSVNYKTMWTDIPYMLFFFNSAKLAFIITFLQLLTCSFAAFSFSKLHYPGRDKIFLIYLATLMVPWHAIIIPQFIIIRHLHLYDTHMSLILIHAFTAFGVFVLRQNMLAIPDSLVEAPKIDGCGPFAIYWRIVLPLTKIGLLTLTVLTFNAVWNDYMGPLIYLDSVKKRTIQLGLAWFKREFDTDYGAIMAGTVISIVPIVIVYSIAQKHIIAGVAFAGVKG